MRKEKPGTVAHDGEEVMAQVGAATIQQYGQVAKPRGAQPCSAPGPAAGTEEKGRQRTAARRRATAAAATSLRGPRGNGPGPGQAGAAVWSPPPGGAERDQPPRRWKDKRREKKP